MKATRQQLLRALTMLLAGATLAWAAGLPAAEITLKTGTSWNDKFPMKAMLKDVLKPKLEAYSDGRLTTEIHMAKSLCSEKTCVEQVKLGQIDIGTAFIVLASLAVLIEDIRKISASRKKGDFSPGGGD